MKYVSGLLLDTVTLRFNMNEAVICFQTYKKEIIAIESPTILSCFEISDFLNISDRLKFFLSNYLSIFIISSSYITDKSSIEFHETGLMSYTLTCFFLYIKAFLQRFFELLSVDLTKIRQNLYLLYSLLIGINFVCCTDYSL